MADALWAGLLAGLGVALPLGAIGVLLVNEGLVRGWRIGMAGALAVAMVDGAYATVAVAVGSVVAVALAPHEQAIGMLGAIVLFGIALRGLVLTSREASGRSAAAGADPTAPAGTTSARGLGRTYLKFLAMTAINPLTAVYFVALTVALGERVQGPGLATAFVIGVVLASLAWQSVLVALGAVAGGRLPDGARTAISVAGYLAVAGYGVVLALG